MTENKLAIIRQYITTKYLRQFRDRHQLLAWQHRQVVNYLQKIVPKSRFYRDRFHGLDLEDWQSFEPIDKSIMMANFDDLNTVGISKARAFELAIAAENTRDFSPTIDGYTIGLSSGTSGNRGLFLVSAAERQLWAGTILAKALPRSLFTAERIAFFLRANSNLYETVGKQRIRFEYFDLLASVDSHLDRLNRLQPTILVAPPSMLRLLADELGRGNLSIAPIKIISVAEVLDPLDERYLESCFERPIHQLYQCTEGFLASTCEYGTLHLNEDIVAIQKEYLDRDSGRFMPIVTDFHRSTQPIVRYRLDDILTESTNPCPCGSVMTAISRIEGRCDDIFWLPNLTGDRLVPLFPDFIRRAIITAAEDIREYRAVQIGKEAIDIYLKVPPQLRQSIAQKIDRAFIDLCQQLQCRVPNITYNDYPEIIAPTRKLRRIQRDFKLDDDHINRSI